MAENDGHPAETPQEDAPADAPTEGLPPEESVVETEGGQTGLDSSDPEQPVEDTVEPLDWLEEGEVPVRSLEPEPATSDS